MSLLQSAFTVLQVGSSVLEGKNRRALDRAGRGAQQAVQEAQARVQNAGNFREAAVADLNRAVQSIGNRRMREQATRREAAARAAVLAQRDAQGAATFEARVAAAEAAGALAAEAVASGTTGGTADLLSSTAALQQARQQHAATRAARAQNYGAEIDSADAARTAVAGMDNRTVFATIDRAVAVPTGRQVAGNWTDDVRKSGVTGKDYMALAENVYKETNSLLFRFGFGTKGGGPEPYIPQEQGDFR